MKRRSLMLGAAAGFGGLVLPLQGFASGRGPADTPIADITLPNLTADAAAPVVYYSPVVTPMPCSAFSRRSIRISKEKSVSN